LEEVEGVFGGLEGDFELERGVGLDLRALGRHVEDDLFFVAGLDVLFLDGPEDLKPDGQVVGEHDLAGVALRHEALEAEVDVLLREEEQALLAVEREEELLVQGDVALLVVLGLAQLDGLLVGVVERRVDERVLEVLELDLGEPALDDARAEEVHVVLLQREGLGQQVVAGAQQVDEAALVIGTVSDGS